MSGDVDRSEFEFEQEVKLGKREQFTAAPGQMPCIRVAGRKLACFHRVPDFRSIRFKLLSRRVSCRP